VHVGEGGGDGEGVHLGEGGRDGEGVHVGEGGGDGERVHVGGGEGDGEGVHVGGGGGDGEGVHVGGGGGDGEGVGITTGRRNPPGNWVRVCQVRVRVGILPPVVNPDLWWGFCGCRRVCSHRSTACLQLHHTRSLFCYCLLKPFPVPWALSSVMSRYPRVPQVPDCALQESRHGDTR
jgi:hypothetical protein